MPLSSLSFLDVYENILSASNTLSCLFSQVLYFLPGYYSGAEQSVSYTSRQTIDTYDLTSNVCP
jgi:hypothetical protein